jgi:hypothetical protein
VAREAKVPRQILALDAKTGTIVYSQRIKTAGELHTPKVNETLDEVFAWARENGHTVSIAKSAFHFIPIVEG